MMCSEDSGGLQHFGVSVMSKSILYLCVSIVVLGGSCAPVQEAHGMTRVLMSALVLANGWEPVWHKDVAFSFSLGTEVTTLDENEMISSGSGPKACVAGNPAQLPNFLALATANPLPFPLSKPRARRH